MGLRLDIFVHFPEPPGDRLAKIEALLHTLIIKENHVSQIVDDVLAAVTALHGEVASGIELIKQLHDLLGNPGDPVDLEKLNQARELAGLDKDTLHDAIVANAPPATP